MTLAAEPLNLQRCRDCGAWAMTPRCTWCGNTTAAGTDQAPAATQHNKEGLYQ